MTREVFLLAFGFWLLLSASEIADLIARLFQ